MKPIYALFLLLLAGCAAAPADHYQPFVLDQTAGERQATDPSTARIFVERAKRIAPQGLMVGHEGASPAPAVDGGQGDEPPVPALWDGEVRKEVHAD